MAEQRTPSADQGERPSIHAIDRRRPALVAATLLAGSVPILALEARRRRDPELFWMLLAALQLKLLGAVARYQVAYRTYDGVADAESYHRRGRRVMRRLRSGRLDPGLESLTGSDFIRLLTGGIYSLTGASRLSGFLVFSWLGFWGQFLFHRAFEQAMPGSGARTYSRLVLFLPSMLFWPSGTGKDSWMVLSLGAGAYGASRELSGRGARGLDLLGMLAAARVRPHVAGMLGAATAAAYLLAGRRRRGVAMGAATGLQIAAAYRYLRSSGIETREGTRSALEQTAERTTRGGSSFEPAIPSSPAQAAMVPATVLFRPHPLEAHNPQALAAAAEGVFLLLLTLTRIRSTAALRGVRRRPYQIMALAYSAAFCAAYAAIANFGLLARQRVQLLPFYLILLCGPAPRRRRARFLRRA